MDLNSLKDQVSNLTLYDLKAGFRKAQNGASDTQHGVIPISYHFYSTTILSLVKTSSLGILQAILMHLLSMHAP